MNRRLRNMTQKMARSVFLIAFWLSLPLAGRAAEEACPFSGFKGPVLAAGSFAGWEDYGTVFGGGHVGDVIVEAIRHEILPSLLKIADATEALAKLPGSWDQLASATNWDRLRKTQIAFSISEGMNHIPKVALRFTPPQDEAISLYQDIGKLFAGIVSQASENLVWKDDGAQASLVLVASSSPSFSDGDDPVRLLSLSRMDSHVFLESLPDVPPKKGSGQELCEEASFQDLWKKLPQPLASTLYFNLQHVFGFVRTTVKGILDDMDDSRPVSSFVLDETSEALLREDPETLEKLRQVEKDFNSLMPDMNPAPLRRPVMRLLHLLEAQGQVLSGLSREGNSIQSVTLWQPAGEPAGVALFATEPLSPAFLSLLQINCIEASIAALPDYKTLYTTLLDIFKDFPDSGKALADWDSIQDLFDIWVEDDLLTALGRNSAWLTTPKQKSSSSGLPVVSNDLTVVLEIASREAAQRTLAAAGKILADYGISASTKTLDVGILNEVDMSLLGKVSWIIPQDLDVFILTNSASTELVVDIARRLKNPSPLPPAGLPGWKSLQKIWSDQPAAVSMEDLSTTWKQTIDQLRSTQMMMALMGPIGSGALPFFQLGLKIMTTVDKPEAMYTVAHNENGLRISRTLLVYPEEPEP